MRRKLLLLAFTIFAASLTAGAIAACGGSNAGDDGSNTGDGGHKHQFTYYESCSPTCTQDGNVAYWHCDICGKNFDEAGDELTEVILKATGHTWGDWETISEATCTEDGSRKHTCEMCYYEETETVTAPGHTLVPYDEKQADCTHIGSAKYFECSACGKLYADEQTVTEILFEDTYTAPSGHDFGEWKVTKPATCTEDGEKTRSCKCGYTETQAIPAYGHSADGEKCTRCNTPVTQGLAFEETADKEGYRCTGWASMPDEDGQPVDLIIPSQYNGKPVEEVRSGAYPFAGDARIRTVSLPDTLTEIYPSTFENCTGIIKVYMPAELNQIGDSAFKNCSSLTELNLPKYVSIDNSAFAGCNSIERATLDADDLACIPNKANLVSLNIISGNTLPSLEECTGLVNLTVADSIKIITLDAFTDCTELQFSEYANALYLGNEENRYSVLVRATSKDITYCFVHPEAKAIAYSAFKWCEKLTGIRIPEECDVTSIPAEAFSGCKALKAIELSEKVKAIKEGAFAGCTALETVIMPDVTNFAENSFEDCNNVKKLTMHMSAYNYISHEKTEELEITGGTINVGAFSYTTTIKKVTIGSGVKTIGDYPFDNCTGIETIILEEGIESIGYAAFRATNIVSITIPASVKQMSGSAFEYCWSLLNIEVDEDNQWYASKDGILYNKEMTKFLCYPAGRQDSVYEIPSNVAEVSSEAFFSCNSLTQIKVGPNTLIADGAIQSCDALTAITVDENNAYHTDIDGILFSKDLTTLLRYPEGKTEILYEVPEQVTTIYNSAFSDCRNLTDIVIGENVTTLGDSAFYRCLNLKNVFYKGSEEEWQTLFKGYNNDPLEQAECYIYSETQPTEEGNFWHYGADGKTPEIW